MVPRLRAASFAALLTVVLAGGCTIVTSTPLPPNSDVDAGYSSSGGNSGTSSGGFESDASACSPANVATFNPGAYHAASGAWQGACVPGPSGDPIALFYADCLGPSANATACDAFRTANAACVACLLTPDTAAKYGPVIDHQSFVTANVAGCIELAGDAVPGGDELACATAVQRLAGCELAACEANCPVDDAASLARYEGCASESETAGCATYATSAACATAQMDAGTLGAACLSDFATFYQVVAPHFCAAVPAEGDASAPHPDSGTAKPDGSVGHPPDAALD